MTPRMMVNDEKCLRYDVDKKRHDVGHSDEVGDGSEGKDET
jgi:hypothetical protein